MLIVAPSGSTKELVRLEIPARSSTHVIVKGSVPFEEAVEKAVINAGLSARKYSSGERFAQNFKISGSTTVA
jgi:hypothetical protein